MTDFRLKILGLAAVASLFASVSYGQVVTCGTLTNGVNPYVSIQAGLGSAAVAPLPVVATPAAPLLLRGEGETELVSDSVLTGCSSTSAAATAQVIAFLSAPVTSKATGTVAPITTEAALLITPYTIAGGVNTYGAQQAPVYGVVNGTTVTFTGVSFPVSNGTTSAFVIEIANIRVNASTLGATAAPVAVTESIFAGFNGQSTINVSGLVVGEALQSLVAPSFTLLSSASGIPNVASYPICTANPATATSFAGVSFTIVAAETLGGFFKSGPGATTLSTVAPNSEYGTYVNTAATGQPGVPAAGTRIQVVLNGVPSSATVFVPTSIADTTSGTYPTNTTNALDGVLTLTSGATGGLSAVTASTSPASIPANTAALTPTNGTVTIVYEVTGSAPAIVQSFQIPVYVSFAANSTTATTITVLESYAPTGTTPTEIPFFATPSNTALTGPAITGCVTNLLFPFVTSQLGFDTGVAIANTSADPFGKYGAVPSGTTAPSGACTLNYYGTGAPSPSTVTTPSIASGATYAFVNSSVAPGFQGYVIVQCPFVAGHGYAFVTNTGSAGNAGVAQGYIALSLPAANSNGSKRIFPGAGAGNTESVGQ